MSASTSSVDRPARRSYFADHIKNNLTHIGRAKGTKNKVGASVRYAIQHVFTGLGGWEAMLEWAKDNPDVFYGQVIPKLLPTELAESGAGVPIRVLVYAPQAGEPVSPQMLNAELQAEADK